MLIRIALLAGAGALAYAIFWAMGADPRGLAVVLAEMIKAPWTVVTLVDLYLGFFIIAVIIAVTERHWAWSVFWALPVFFLGNVWAAIWLVVRLSRFPMVRERED